MTTLRATPNRHCHTENLSGKRYRYFNTKKSIQREGSVGGQKTTITAACESNVNKMIDSYNSTVKSLRPC